MYFLCLQFQFLHEVTEDGSQEIDLNGLQICLKNLDFEVSDDVLKIIRRRYTRRNVMNFNAYICVLARLLALNGEK